MKGPSCFVLLLLVAGVFSQNFLGYLDINYTFQPEGIEYLNFNGDIGFLLSSLNSGDGTIYKCVDSGRCTAWSNGGGNLTGTVGLQVDIPNRLLYAANINTFVNLTANASIAAIHLGNGTLAWNADLTTLGTKGAAKLVNDVSLPDAKGNIYATESFQGLIFQVSSTGNSTVFASGGLLAPQDTFGLGANGIEILSYNGEEFLLVGVSGLTQATSPLVKIPLNNPNQMSAVNIDSDLVYGFDGMYYDRTASILYIVNNQENLVQKLASSDGWESATLIDSKSPNCPGAPPSSIVHLNDPNLAGSAYVLCPNSFSRSGPYQIENIQFYYVTTEFEYYDYYTSNSATLSYLFALILCLIFSLAL